MDTIGDIFTWCCSPCCNNFVEYTQPAMLNIDKALGNLKASQETMCFLGLLNMKESRAKLVHYLASKCLYDDVSIPETDDGMDLPEAQQNYIR